jgi:hypothetical protein
MSLQKRECGECNACCLLFVVHDESFKVISDAGQWCSHCTQGIGCGIYSSRPPACRNYSCFWRDGALGEECRPDKWGVVIDFEEVPGHETRLIYFRELHPGALDGDRAQAMMNGLINDAKNFVVGCYLDGRKKPLKPLSMSEEDAVAFLEATFAHWKKKAEESGISLE